MPANSRSLRKGFAWLIFAGEAPLLSKLNTNKGLFHYWEDLQGGKDFSGTPTQA